MRFEHRHDFRHPFAVFQFPNVIAKVGVAFIAFIGDPILVVDWNNGKRFDHAQPADIAKLWGAELRKFKDPSLEVLAFKAFRPCREGGAQIGIAYPFDVRRFS